MNDAVFDEIPDRVGNGMAVTVDLDGAVCADKRNAPLLCDGPGSQTFNHGARDSVQFDGLEFKCDSVESSNAQQLLDEAIHPGHVSFQLCELAITLHGFKGARHDGKRRAELMCGIRCEP